MPSNANDAKTLYSYGIRPFPMLTIPTLAGSFFPYAAAFVKKHPEYAAVNAFGKKTETIDPAVLLQENSPFLPFMEKVIERFLKAFPDELHIDYEFPFMPQLRIPHCGSASISGPVRSSGSIFSPITISVSRRHNQKRKSPLFHNWL